MKTSSTPTTNTITRWPIAAARHVRRLDMWLWDQLAPPFLVRLDAWLGGQVKALFRRGPAGV